MSTATDQLVHSTALDEVVAGLAKSKNRWAEGSIEERIRLLQQIKHCLIEVASEWAEIASDKKGIPAGSPLRGEEWMSGPYALMSACNGLIATLSEMEEKNSLIVFPRARSATHRLLFASYRIRYGIGYC